MALRATPTIAICLTAGIAAGIALARPDTPPAAPVAAPVAGSATPAGAFNAAAVSIEGFAFSGIITVPAGAEIAVTNLDGVPHTATADDGSFNTGNLAQGAVGTIVAPSVPGTYSYFCAIHPSMTASLIVK